MHYLTDEDQYMAFGLSGSTTTSSMDDADVIVAHYTGNQPKADDYDLNQRSQVSPDAHMLSKPESQRTRLCTVKYLFGTSDKREWLNP